MHLDPGDRHPNVPCLPAAMARRLAVEEADIQQWIADGLPVAEAGLVDPYAVVSWLSWGRLDRCPVLARRWRSWLRWFTTPGRPCRLTVARAQELYLPEPSALRWWVPEPPDAVGQRVLARQWNEGEPWGLSHRLLVRNTLDSVHRWQAEDEIELIPTAVEPRDRADLERLVGELAGAFVYAYRRHRAAEAPAWTGTCLDLAQLCGAELERRGRAWRLVCGVVAHRALANAHFWVEVDDGPAGWIPLDPTIPAVARMLGTDWRALLPLAVGRHDGRRIRVGDSTQPIAEAPGGPSLGSAAGEIDAGGRGGLFCCDWSVGECSWSVSGS